MSMFYTVNSADSIPMTGQMHKADFHLLGKWDFLGPGPALQRPKSFYIKQSDILTEQMVFSVS